MSNEAIETEIIGDAAVATDNITPSTYFEYVKGMKDKINDTDQQLVIDNILKMIEKCKITNQTAMAKRLAHQAKLAVRELDVAKQGFDVYVDRKVIEKFIQDVEGKAIKIIELSEYTREIPDDQIDKITLAQKLFDKLYIIYTDYALKDTKKVAKERRDKDPIVFGAFLDNDGDMKTKIYVEDRLFFICDWVEEKCDLTLEEIAKDIKGKTKEDITYKITTPKEVDDIKQYLNSFEEPIDNQKPVNIFQKIKKTVSRKTTSRKATKKKTGDDK